MAAAALGTVCPCGLNSLNVGFSRRYNQDICMFCLSCKCFISASRTEGVRTAPKPLLLGGYDTTIFLFIILIRPVLVDIFIADLEEGVNNMLMTFLDDDKTELCLPVGTQKNNAKGTSKVRRMGGK